MILVSPTALQERRIRAGHTTRSLADRSGVSQQRISELEQRPRNAWPPTVAALARALGCEIADITEEPAQ